MGRSLLVDWFNEVRPPLGDSPACASLEAHAGPPAPAPLAAGIFQAQRPTRACRPAACLALPVTNRPPPAPPAGPQFAMPQLVADNDRKYACECSSAGMCAARAPPAAGAGGGQGSLLTSTLTPRPPAKATRT